MNGISEKFYNSFCDIVKEQFPFIRGDNSENEKMYFRITGMLYVSIEKAGDITTDDGEAIAQFREFEFTAQMDMWTDVFKICNSYQDALYFTAENLKDEEQSEALQQISNEQRKELFAKFLIVPKITKPDND